MPPAGFHFPPGGRGIETPSSAILTISVSTHRKSSPLLLENAPGTFSHTMNLGFPCSNLISFTILTYSRNNTDCSPSSPVLFPAMLMFWQGEPPATMSTGSRSAPFIRPMSPSCCASGKRTCVTLIGNGSISDSQTVRIPTYSPASSKPPLPEKKEPIFIRATPFSSRTNGNACGASPRACGSLGRATRRFSSQACPHSQTLKAYHCTVSQGRGNPATCFPVPLPRFPATFPSLPQI